MDTKEKRRRPRTTSGGAAPGRRPVRKERKLRDSDVVYTPPKPFKRGRFLLHLATVAAVVLAVVFGMSIFFKVQTIKVSGCNKYTPWDVSQKSGIEIGSNLMTISRSQVGGNIISALPYVETVRVGIILPDTVNIEITEMDAVYAIEDVEGSWWLMNETGRIVEQTNGVTAEKYTRVLGLRLEVPAVGQQAVAQETETTKIPVDEPEPEESTEPTDPEKETKPGPTISVGITGAQRLDVVLMLLQHLSRNSISGEIDSVDVTSLTAVNLSYDDERFLVNLGNTDRLEYKINALKTTVAKMESYESGHLDLSFTKWPDKVGYTPFS